MSDTPDYMLQEKLATTPEQVRSAQITITESCMAQGISRDVYLAFNPVVGVIVLIELLDTLTGPEPEPRTKTQLYNKRKQAALNPQMETFERTPVRNSNGEVIA